MPGWWQPNIGLGKEKKMVQVMAWCQHATIIIWKSADQGAVSI